MPIEGEGPAAPRPAGGTPSSSGAARAHRAPAARRRARRDLVVGAVVALLVVAVTAFAAVALHGRPAARGPQPVPRVSTSSPARLVAVVGDDLSVGSPQRTWVGAAARTAGVQVAVRASAGSGYVASSGSGTFVELAGTVPATARLVVVFGGGRDTGRGALELLRAETRAVAAARDAAPDAAVVVVGPLTAGGTATVRSTLRSAAALTGARFVDPVARHWVQPSQAGIDGERPTAAGRAAIAARLAAVLRG